MIAAAASLAAIILVGAACNAVAALRARAIVRRRRALMERHV